ncbi:MAG: NTP transferase domain-containing protein, partial [Clostridia bacterium]|nr:NTP transferase domain-containing protein [Clostridia bacterium]
MNEEILFIYWEDSMHAEVRAILLCAGRGTRMNDDSTHKVCFPVDGVPVVRRLIGDLKKAGVSRFTVVVGFMADAVKNCLKDEENVTFAYQETQCGTADAVRCGLNALEKEGY